MSLRLCASLPLSPQTRRLKQKPTPQLWLGREIPFDPEAALGLLPCMEEPAQSSGKKKKVLTQTRCNLLSACQHLECWQGLCTWARIELPSLRISEVALMCFREASQPLSPAQPCVLALASKSEQQVTLQGLLDGAAHIEPARGGGRAMQTGSALLICISR